MEAGDGLRPRLARQLFFELGAALGERVEGAGLGGHEDGLGLGAQLRAGAQLAVREGLAALLAGQLAGEQEIGVQRRRAAVADGERAGEAGRAAEDMDEHDEFYRAHYDGHRHPTLEYDEARIGYGLGHVAGRNPDYAGLEFDEIESDLRRGWNYDRRDFETMRLYVRTGYERTMGTARGDDSRERSKTGRPPAER